MYRAMFDIVEIEMDKDKRCLRTHAAFDNGGTSKDFYAVLRLHAVSEIRIKVSFNTPPQPIIIKA